MNKPAFPYPEGRHAWIDEWTYVSTHEGHDVWRHRYNDEQPYNFLAIPEGHAPLWFKFDRTGWESCILDGEGSRTDVRRKTPPEEVRRYVEALYQLHS